MNDMHLWTFIGVAAVLTLTPGADTMLVIRSVLARGQWAGIVTAVGICCGLFVHASLSAVGLSLLLQTSATAFNSVKMLGAGYLVYLGFRSLVSASRTHSDLLGAKAAPRAGAQWGQSFLTGLLTNILNPKVAIFYVAFLPQFIGPHDQVLSRSLLLAAIHGGMGVAWLSLISLLLGRVRSWLTRPRTQRSLEAVAGTVLLGFGVRLAFARR